MKFRFIQEIQTLLNKEHVIEVDNMTIAEQQLVASLLYPYIEETSQSVKSSIKLDSSKIINQSFYKNAKDVHNDKSKGGDRTLSNLPNCEIMACKKVGAKIVTGLGEKIEASSKLVGRKIFFENKEMMCDLHIHTNCSDGGLDPSLILEKAVQDGVKILSITDHNNIDAYSILKNVAHGDILIINGVECDVKFQDKDLHILMYGFDLENKHIKQFFGKIRKDDISSFRKMLKEVCQKHSLNISEKDILKFEKDNVYFDKVRLNNFLFSLGYATSPREAFNLFTKDIVEKKRKQVTAEEFFKLAKHCNAITMLAHPMKYTENKNDLNEIKSLILELQKIGLTGIEVFNNRQTKMNQEDLFKFAKENNLEYSAGSDFHCKIGVQDEKEIGHVLSQKITLNMFSPSLIKTFLLSYKK